MTQPRSITTPPTQKSLPRPPERLQFNRGEQNSPILAINHWIDKFPPPVGANKKILDRAYIVKRARQCEKERGLHASLIATDFYDLGGVVGAARELNGLGYEPPAKTR